MRFKLLSPVAHAAGKKVLPAPPVQSVWSQEEIKQSAAALYV
jgi:hypothetical protein